MPPVYLKWVFFAIVAFVIVFTQLRVRHYRDNGPKWKMHSLLWGGYAAIYLSLTGIMWVQGWTNGYDLLWIVDGFRGMYKVFTA